MREIKFRAWDEWAKKFWYSSDDYLKWFPLRSLYNGDGCCPGLVFQEYTGLLDKDGKEIYEEDIVVLTSILKDGDRKVCTAVMDGWQSSFECKDGFYCSMGATAENYREVIGNIWEHPELLDAKE